MTGRIQSTPTTPNTSVAPTQVLTTPPGPE